MVRATLDTHLRLKIGDLTQGTFGYICGALTIPNPFRDTAIREKLWNAQQIPRNIEIFEVSGDEFILPRGFYGRFLAGAQTLSLPVEWLDERRFYEFFPLTTEDGTAIPPIRLRDYQLPAVRALVEYEQGIYEAPTGAGKTAVALEAIRLVDQPTLIIVDKASLAEQWRDRIREVLHVEPGYVGEGKQDARPITVALRQALHELDRDEWDLCGLVTGRFWDLFGTVVIDECHHLASSGTLQELLALLPARYRWGLSATPDRDPAWFPVAEAVIGPILHVTSPEEAGESLVTPSVRVLVSDLEFDYVPTRYEDKVDGDGNPVISRRTGQPFRVRIQNNYGELLKLLCCDPARNALIAGEVARLAAQGAHVLIVSRRKDQLEAISDALREQILDVPVWSLVGGEGGQRGRDVAQSVDSCDGGCVLLSTVAEEGLDIVSLDVVVLAYPFRNPQIVKQPVGRVMRTAPGKTSALVIDIWDRGVGLLASQYRERAMYYRTSGYELEVVEPARA